MKSILYNLLGEYVPIEVSETVVQLDWPWIFSALVLITLISCTAWFACKVICGVLRD